MAVYVLVHGAWHGGWCWDKVARILRSNGDAVFTPTLTGLGERAHLASRAIGLETHVEDVLGLLEFEDLTEVILVGHSYAGIVVTGVADREPERIARLVYLDAAVPRNGQCIFDRSSPQFRARIEEQVHTDGDGWRIPVPDAALLGLVREEDIRWVMPRLTPHPYRTFREPLHLRGPDDPVVPRTYIDCTGDTPRTGARTSQADGIDDYHEIPCGHDAMVIAPEQVATLLREVAR